jgi:hypothetical protein
MRRQAGAVVVSILLVATPGVVLVTPRGSLTGHVHVSAPVRAAFTERICRGEALQSS